METRINFNNYFSEERTLDRLKTCDFYFENIKTVAFEEVRSEKSSGKKLLIHYLFQITEIERDLPLAFSIVLHSNIGLLEAQLGQFPMVN